MHSLDVVELLVLEVRAFCNSSIGLFRIHVSAPKQVPSFREAFFALKFTAAV